MSARVLEFPRERSQKRDVTEAESSAIDQKEENEADLARAAKVHTLARYEGLPGHLQMIGFDRRGEPCVSCELLTADYEVSKQTATDIRIALRSLVNVIDNGRAHLRLVVKESDS